MSRLSETIKSPEDLKKLSIEQLPEVCAGLREELVEITSETGGHLGASLGTVDLIVALHYVFDSPKDKFVWDVGHQVYAHKLITGRRDRMKTIRTYEGLSGFTSHTESVHDHFSVGHASTAVSQGLGLAVARDLKGGDEKIVSIFGDGALTGGVCYEALNNAGHIKTDFLCILNDNEMSISPNVGAISTYLNRIISAPIYNRVRKKLEEQLNNFPRLRKLVKNAEEGFKNLLVPGIVFEELGFRYFGPVDGHDVKELVKLFKNIKDIKKPILLHLITKKGKGCEFAEKDPVTSHGVQPFHLESGAPKKKATVTPAPLSYTNCFVNNLTLLAEEDPKVVAITAAMREGTGLRPFQDKFPDRFFDVGIAEQHAVSFAGALARSGIKPICAIYSTFLQRAFDQLIHDVTIQDVNVTFCLDRAGVVGPDGPTHQGLFDIGYVGVIPNSVICSPWTDFEMNQMMRLSLEHQGVFSIRYPKENVPEIEGEAKNLFKIGEGEIVADGNDVAILAIGSFVSRALVVRELLREQGIQATVVNLRFAKPLDETLLKKLSESITKWVVIEDHVYSGGLGARVLEFCERNELRNVDVQRIAVPDEVIQHGEREIIFDKFGLTPEKISKTILDKTKDLSALS